MSASGRVRPLSGSGVWSLLTWLRSAGDGDDDDSASSTSGGSDRTAASFAYLPPAHCAHLAGASVRHVPPDPPTDTYRKRLYDGNLRRQYERDLTLHSKYLLPLGEQRYDACSLPPARRRGRVEGGRDRRATSESLRRVHVPGKRRAPLPPRRRSDKRPAPPPPPSSVSTVHQLQKDLQTPEFKEADLESQMSVNRETSDAKTPSERLKPDAVFEGGTDKTSKKDPNVKIRDKSFLKQIFESRKRYSSVEVAPAKLLPSIRELDNQAAELLESYKLKAFEQNNNIPNTEMNSNRKKSGDKWFCTRCLKKYDATMVTCLDCLSEAKISSNSSKYKDSCLALKHSETQTNTDKYPIPSSSKNLEEKQKLKEMLKEMKHSLPKQPKPDKNEGGKNNFYFKAQNIDSGNNAKETPTLPMGSTIHKNIELESQSSSSKINHEVTIEQNKNIYSSPISVSSSRPTENVVITQTTVLMNSAPRDFEEIKQSPSNNFDSSQPKIETVKKEIATLKNKNVVTDQPLKISTLLNPVYIPKLTVTKEIKTPTNISLKETFLHKTTPEPGVSIAMPVPNSKIICLSTSTVAIKSTISETKQQSANTVSSQSVIPYQKNSINMALPVQLSIKEVSPTIKNVEKNSIPSFSQNNSTKQSITADTNSSSTVNTSITAQKVSANTISADTTATITAVGLESDQPTVDLHYKRRDLISQLEKSIANGDERAAAEAAIRLAQLRLSCSVLSFPSQIIAESSTNSSNKTVAEKTKIPPDMKKKINKLKVDSATQSVGTRCLKSITKPDEPDPILEDNAVANDTKDKKYDPKSGKLLHEIINEDTKCKTPDKETAISNTSRITSPKPSTSKDVEDTVSVEVWVEDRVAARGPVRLRVGGCSGSGGAGGGSLRSLRREAQRCLGVPTSLQRWIIGNTLCLHDDMPLVDLAGPDLKAPFYLCLVESETAREVSTPEDSATSEATATESGSPELRDEAGDVYSELVRLERQALVPNTEPFVCSVCLEECAAAGGAVLRECAHSFCRECLAAAAVHSAEPEPQCPARGCVARVLDRELRALLSAEQLERRLARSLAVAETAAPHAFHCRTRDCAGWALCDPAPAPAPAAFLCPVCGANNCVPCKAIHEGETCEEYRRRMEQMAGEMSAVGDEASAAWVQSLLRRGEALACPQCGTVICKQWGCDWVRCAACRTEICWATRARRWGPAGKGDVSAGCRCGVDGKKCHPACGYCH